MRFHLYSDLHFEFFNTRDDIKKWIDSLNARGHIETAILAGDIATFVDFSVVLKSFCERYEHVIFVPGNHEYYHSSPTDITTRLRTIEELLPGLHVLSRDIVEIQGQRILGTTLWFSEQPDNWKHELLLNDFSKIKDFKPWVYLENQKNRGWLAKNICNGDVVVTHHLPLTGVIDNRYRDMDNRFYVCDMSQLVRATPNVWCFGHTHSSVDKVLHGTRFVSNPQGYVPDHLNPEFKKDFLIEVGTTE